MTETKQGDRSSGMPAGGLVVLVVLGLVVALASRGGPWAGMGFLVAVIAGVVLLVRLVRGR